MYRRQSSRRRKPYVAPEPRHRPNTATVWPEWSTFIVTDGWSLEDEFIMQFRLFVLELCNWNRTQAKEILGISDRGFHNALNRYREKGVFIAPGDTKFRIPLTEDEWDQIRDRIYK